MNNKTIRDLKYTGRTQVYWVARNLYLSVGKSKKTWQMRKTENRKTKVTTIGHFPEMSLKDVLAYSGSIESGGMLIQALMKRFYQDVVLLESKTPKLVWGYLKTLGQQFHNLPVTYMTRRMMSTYIQDYARERGPSGADKIRQYARRAFDYAVEIGELDVSPINTLTRRVTFYHPVPRRRFLSDEEIRSLFEWTDSLSAVLRFLLLTGCRISEVVGPKAGQLQGDRWVIADTKGAHKKWDTKPHWVYLPPLALAQLPLPRVTPTTVQVWLKNHLLDQDYADEDRWRPHDLRRTFSTRANDIGVMPHIVEMCLNHVIPGEARTYNLADREQERIAAAITVSEHVQSLLKEGG